MGEGRGWGGGDGERRKWLGVGRVGRAGNDEA